MRLSYLMTLFLFMFGSIHAEELLLRDNFKKAKAGDYLVILANKTQTLMHISDRKQNIITIEEISIPEGRKPSCLSWREWVNQGAIGNTSWVIYELDLNTGGMLRYYSFTKNNWFEIPEADNFISKLFNLRLTKIPDYVRKKIGPKPFSGPDYRSFWQPRMVIDGKFMKGVPFDAWQTRWPKDQSELAGKTIEIYLPQNSDLYRAYFPYWLQINGAIGKAKIRMIDSGVNLTSPRKMMQCR